METEIRTSAEPNFRTASSGRTEKFSSQSQFIPGDGVNVRS